MSLSQILLDLLNNPISIVRERAAHEEIKNLIINEYRLVYQPPGTIENFVDGDRHFFADQITELNLMSEAEITFPGVKEYLWHHITDAVVEWEDSTEIEWIATGILRYIGRDPIPPPLEFDHLMENLRSSLYSQEPMG